MATSKIKGMGYSASSVVGMNTAVVLPDWWTEAVVYVNVAGSTSMRITIPIIKAAGDSPELWEGCPGGETTQRLAVIGNSITLTVSWWYGTGRTDSTMQVFYR